MVTLFKLFKELPECFLGGSPILHSHQHWYKCFNFFISLLTLIIGLFDSLHPAGSDVLFHCDFHLHFPDGVEHLFVASFAPLYFWRNVFLDPLLIFLIELFDFLSCYIFILIINNSSDDFKIFSPVLWVVFSHSSWYPLKHQRF